MPYEIADLRHPAPILAVATSPVGDAVAMGTIGGLEVFGGELATSQPVREAGTVRALAFSPNGKRIVTANQVGEIMVLSSTQQIRYTNERGSAGYYVAHPQWVRWSSNSDFFVASPWHCQQYRADNGKIVRIGDAETLQAGVPDSNGPSIRAVGSGTVALVHAHGRFVPSEFGSLPGSIDGFEIPGRAACAAIERYDDATRFAVVVGTELIVVADSSIVVRHDLGGTAVAIALARDSTIVWMEGSGKLLRIDSDGQRSEIALRRSPVFGEYGAAPDCQALVTTATGVLVGDVDGNLTRISFDGSVEEAWSTATRVAPLFLSLCPTSDAVLASYHGDCTYLMKSPGTRPIAIDVETQQATWDVDGTSVVVETRTGLSRLVVGSREAAAIPYPGVKRTLVSDGARVLGESEQRNVGWYSDDLPEGGPKVAREYRWGAQTPFGTVLASTYEVQLFDESLRRIGEAASLHAISDLAVEGDAIAIATSDAVNVLAARSTGVNQGGSFSVDGPQLVGITTSPELTVAAAHGGTVTLFRPNSGRADVDVSEFGRSADGPGWVCSVRWRREAIQIALSVGRIVEVSAIEIDNLISQQGDRSSTQAVEDPDDSSVIEPGVEREVILSDEPGDYVGDSPTRLDRLDRQVFADQIAVALRTLAAGECYEGPAVLVAGGWGSGKSSIGEMVEDSLTTQLAAGIDHPWTVASYNAWRDRAVSPSWFGILDCIRNAVQPEGIGERVGFRIRESLFRLSVHGGAGTAILLVGALAFAAALAGIQGEVQLSAILGAPLAIGGFVGVISALRRRFVWNALGHAQLTGLGSSTEPLAEAQLLAGWYRAQVTRERWRNYLAAGVPVLVFVALLVWWVVDHATRAGVKLYVAQSWALICFAGVVSLVLLPGVDKLASYARRKWSLAFPTFALLGFSIAVAAGLAAVTACVAEFDEPLQAPWRIVVVMAAVGVALLLVAPSTGSRKEPTGDSDKPSGRLLLKVDDLDRCDASVVVDVLDTLSTVFRSEHSKASEVGGGALPLVTLVLAHDRWIANAYRDRHPLQECRPHKDAPARIGWQFIAKQFDLAVRLPIPTTQAIQQLWSPGPMPRPTAVEARRIEPRSFRSTGDGPSDEPPETDQQAMHQPEVDVAVSFDIAEAEQELRHVLTEHAVLASGNPRDFKRAVNHYRFLRSVFPSTSGMTVGRSALILAAAPWLIDNRAELGRQIGEDCAPVLDQLGAEPLPSAFGGALPDEASSRPEP